MNSIEKENYECILHELDVPTDVVFYLNDIQCALIPYCKDSIMSYESAYGDNFKKYDTLEEMFEDKYWDGKSLMEILDTMDLC